MGGRQERLLFSDALCCRYNVLLKGGTKTRKLCEERGRKRMEKEKHHIRCEVVCFCEKYLLQLKGGNNEDWL